MKVALVSFRDGEYCVRLASAIAQDQDMSVLLFLPKCVAEPYVQFLSGAVGLRTFDIPRLRQPFQQIQMVIRLVRQINGFKPDVIHCQSGQLWFSLALPMLVDSPVVLTVHDASIHPGDVEAGKTPQWVWDRACYKAQERIVHSPQIKQLLLQRLCIPDSTVHIVPIVPSGQYEGAWEHVEEEENLVLFFGRLWEYKGLEYLIQAEPLITSRAPNAKIAIAGRGRDFEHYRRMMVHPDRFIVYNEYVSDEKRAELFRRASVVVVPYIEASQSGIIPIAYHFGKPVVATTVGGLPELVDHGQTGYLVPPRDAKALAEAVIALLQNKGLRIQFGVNGRRKINVECASELIARKTQAVYLQAISRAYERKADSRDSGFQRSTKCRNPPA
jgi:glycosyltransferase involved in cell wall biosynthesis